LFTRRRQDQAANPYGTRPLNMCTQLAYSVVIDAVFIELPAFERFRRGYLDDEEFRSFQTMLMTAPEAGKVIEGTGGLRKIRYSDSRRQKGKRGGLRVIYYYWHDGTQFWLFTIYDKDEADDLTAAQKKMLKNRLDTELTERGRK
jgi:mRNA-degrading endonuclease RelE of RelBE toxin-antitoxin system